MRAVVVGADGGIGAALFRALVARGHTVIGTTRRIAQHSPGSPVFLDLAAEPGALSFAAADVGYICAAMTSLEQCRQQPELARRINLDGPAAVAKALGRAGIKPIFLSSNAVFDCSEPLVAPDRPKRPKSLYGQLKAMAEDVILGNDAQAQVVRLTKVLSRNNALLRSWKAAMTKDERCEAFNDHRLSPVSLEHVVDALIAIGERGGAGVYQVSASRDVTYLEVAQAIADFLGKPRSLVHSRSAQDAGVPQSDVMTYSSLNSARLAQLTGKPAPDPEVAILNAVR